MAKLNRSIVSSLQSKDIRDKVNSFNKGVDFDWKGFDSKNNYYNSFVKEGTDSNVNRVLFWLATKRDDYVRDSFKGGVLYELLGVIMNDDNLEYYTNYITQRFNEDFSNDLTLVRLSLIPHKLQRKLEIQMVVRDTLNQNIFSVSTIASE